MTQSDQDAPAVDVPGMSVPQYGWAGAAPKPDLTAFMIQVTGLFPCRRSK